jgi:S1-C subfamily serine protease
MKLGQKVVAAVLLAVAAGGMTRADEKVYQRTLPSTVLVLGKTANGGASGSGVLVDQKRKLMLTNYHVVQDTKQLVVIFPSYDEDGELIVERAAYVAKLKELRRQGRLVAAKVVKQEPRTDLALVELEKVPEDARAIRLAAKSAKLGQCVHSIGNPGASDGLWLYSQGTVRHVYRRKFVLDGDSEVRARVVETQSPVNSGDSGGPVVNDQGKLVALVQSAPGVLRGQPRQLLRQEVFLPLVVALPGLVRQMTVRFAPAAGPAAHRPRGDYRDYARRRWPSGLRRTGPPRII